MYKITGELIPDKGCCYNGDTKYPRGSNCFYVRLNSTTGMKVYYGLDRKHLLSSKIVDKLFFYASWMSKTGICKKPQGTRYVKLDIVWRGERVRCKAKAIIVKHLDMNYSKGKGEYIMKLKARLAWNGISSKPDYYRPHNIGYDRDDERYYLVDWI